MKPLHALAVATAMTLLFMLPPVAQAAKPAQFNRADIDRDRVITRIEACRGATPALCRHFDRIDLNGDRVLSRAEVRAWNTRTKPHRKPRRY
jgi:hypothetical protein